MTISYKILSQKNVSCLKLPSKMTPIYTVPENKTATISNIILCPFAPERQPGDGSWNYTSNSLGTVQKYPIFPTIGIIDKNMIVPSPAQFEDGSYYFFDILTFGTYIYPTNTIFSDSVSGTKQITKTFSLEENRMIVVTFFDSPFNYINVDTSTLLLSISIFGSENS